MKAAQFRKYGGPDVIEIVGIPKPNVVDGQVLVEVMASSINPFDGKVREGRVKDSMPLELPITICGDFAGVIKELSGDVDEYTIGDEVFGQAAAYGGGSGSMAEFATASINKIAKNPENIDFVEAAALPLVGVSAVQALVDHINLKKGQRILIHGGAGGIGSIAVQIAKALGANVATTVSGDDLEFVKSIGADVAIDYKTEDFTKKIHNFDAVFDTAGGEVTNKSFGVVRDGGVVVWMTGSPDTELAKKFNVKTIAQTTEGNSKRLNKLREFVESGKVRPVVDKVFDLEKTKEAFLFQEEEHPRGKVVVKIK